MTGTSSPAAAISTPCRVAVAGASGRMGRMLIEAIRASDDCVLAGALDVAASPGVVLEREYEQSRIRDSVDMYDLKQREEKK